MGSRSDVLSPYAQSGARLIERGFCALPVVPGTKVPGAWVGGGWRRASDWAQKYRDRLPTEIEVSSWESRPDAGVCVVLGKASHGLVAVDIDVDDAVAAVTRALPYTPVRKRGRKGETLFFRAEGTIPLRIFNRINFTGGRERMVDILADGRQTVLAPSAHPDSGAPYTWTGERALEDVNIDELPALRAEDLEAIADALRPLGYRDEPVPLPTLQVGDADSPFRRLNDHALAHLGSWVEGLPLARLRRKAAGYEAVADWRASNSGRPISKRKLNLSITPHGITDFGDGPRGYTAIDLLVACGRAPDAERAFGLLADLTGWGKSVDIRLPERPTIVDAGVVADAETGEVIPTPEPAAAKVAQEQGVDVLSCPGLVGEIARWIVDTAKFPQPLLAMGAALTIVGTVAGRHLAGPTHSGTHLYVVGVAGTGSGKDHPLKAISRVLVAAKLSHLVGPGDLTSVTSIVNAVVRAPASVAAMDEMGAFLARGKARMASTHEQGKSAMLRTLWGSSFDAVPTTERAGEQFRLLHAPAFSLYGTSTAEEFYDALGDADTRNGLLNRFLILEAVRRPAWQTPTLDRREVPASIVEGLRAIYWRRGDAAGDHGRGDVPSPDPAVVEWRDEFAEMVFDELVQDVHRKMDANPEEERFLVRTAEMAVRMATIRAIGIDAYAPRVNVEDMAWGAALAWKSAEAMIEGARDRIASNERETFSNRIILALRKRGGQASARDLQRAIGNSMHSKVRDDIIKMLIEAEVIARVDLTDARSDTVKKVGYRLV